MDRLLDVYLNTDINKVVLGCYINLDDNYIRLTARDLLLYIDELENWDDVDQEVYDELFKEYNIDLEEWKDENVFYVIDDVISQVKDYVYS